jgi:hypothetical protein
LIYFTSIHSTVDGGLLHWYSICHLIVVMAQMAKSVSDGFSADLAKCRQPSAVPPLQTTVIGAFYDHFQPIDPL